MGPCGTNSISPEWALRRLGRHPPIRRMARGQLYGQRCLLAKPRLRPLMRLGYAGPRRTPYRDRGRHRVAGRVDHRNIVGAIIRDIGAFPSGVAAIAKGLSPTGTVATTMFV